MKQSAACQLTRVCSCSDRIPYPIQFSHVATFKQHKFTPMHQFLALMHAPLALCSNGPDLEGDLVRVLYTGYAYMNTWSREMLSSLYVTIFRMLLKD